MLLLIAAVGSICYFVFIVTIVNKLEQAMLDTMVEHETAELISEYMNSPALYLPTTGAIQSFLKSRNSTIAIPDHLKDLAPGEYHDIKTNGKSFHVVVIDLKKDLMYVAFEVTQYHNYNRLLIMALVVGGILTLIGFLVAGLWWVRKNLLPVSHLAEELSSLDPVQRNVRIEEKYSDYEVGLIARAFDEYMDRLDEFVQREQSFTAAISHELRTPVSVIVTSLDLLELKGIKPDQQKVFKRIKVSTNYMHKVINSLLFFARHVHDVADESMPLIELTGVCENVVAQYLPIAEEKGLSLTFDRKQSAHVRMLENHIEIILGNLVRNSIDHTKNGGITITLTSQGFSITDTGSGMNNKQIDLILDSCKQHPKGDTGGLGLYLVTNICRYYDLRLVIDSVIGQGSTFSVLLPNATVGRIQND
jgi:signal transduction histidine kinase